MAGNEWMGGYLDAILDTGIVLDETKNGSGIGEGKAAAAKYFVSELTESNEFDIQQIWMKAAATKNTQARSSRVENFCWRIWHMTRKRKQMQWEEARRLAHRAMEIEEGRLDMASDNPGETSEGLEDDDGPPDALPSAVPTSGASAAANAVFTKTPGEEPERKLYMVLISLHGLVRGENMELGRDSDTGGQIKYVVEFARALAALPQVYRVDLLTRQILSKEVDWSYGEPTEMLSTLEDGGGGESGGAYIVRIPCGPREEYISKELLWPHVPEFVDGALSHIVHMARVLGEQVGGGEPVWPHVVHGHYADAGDIAGLLSGALGVPMVLTGHSLGRNKLEQLLKQGRQSPEDINNTYKIMRRIEAEEFALDSAELVITSTRQEIDQQWGLYDGFDVKLERGLRAWQQKGMGVPRYMPRMVVVPPGMDFSNVVKESEEVEGAEARPEPPIWAQVMRFFTNPRKPIILALARPDPKKNLVTLLKAFGECAPLRELANLVLIMGNRDSIDNMSSGNAEILTTVLKLIDRYDLYGQVSYPKHHKQFEVPHIYRLAAKSKGVFVNPALVEPFGLTLIEAAAHGLPMVATKNGGPVDIQKALDNGVLVDPHDQEGIASALLRMVADRATWTKYHDNGLKNIHCYSWPEHCRKYLARVSQCRMRHPRWRGDAMMDILDTESLGDSLRDARDLSLRLSMSMSIDGKSMNSPADLVRRLAEFEAASQSLTRRAGGNWSTGLQSMREEEGEEGAQAQTIIGGVAATRNLRNRKGLVVVALDYYEEGGQAGKSMGAALKAALEAIEGAQLQGLGVALATAMSGAEATAVLTEAGVGLGGLDVVIAGSGSELYYVVKSVGEGKGPLADREGRHLVADVEYVSHIDYRWGWDGLRKSMARLIAATREGGDTQPLGLAEDAQKSNALCLSYKVVDPEQAPSTMALRKRLRMRGLRCHVVYCRNATALHLVPLHASRAQAMRYLFVRRGLDVSKMVVLVGPMGDGDHVEMLSGTHKTLLLADPVPSCSQARRKLMVTTEDASSANAPNVQIVKSVQDVGEALKALKFE